MMDTCSRCRKGEYIQRTFWLKGRAYCQGYFQMAEKEAIASWASTFRKSESDKEEPPRLSNFIT